MNINREIQEEEATINKRKIELKTVLPQIVAMHSQMSLPAATTKNHPNEQPTPEKDQMKTKAHKHHLGYVSNMKGAKKSPLQSASILHLNTFNNMLAHHHISSLD